VINAQIDWIKLMLATRRTVMDFLPDVGTERLDKTTRDLLDAMTAVQVLEADRVAEEIRIEAAGHIGEGHDLLDDLLTDEQRADLLTYAVSIRDVM
jgi:hypothetical protein